MINLIWKFIELRRLIRQLSPDVVISFLTRVNVATSLSTMGFNTRLIICERTWTPFATLNKKLFWFYRLLFKRADEVIVQTDKSKSWLNKNFPENSSTVIPNPVVYPLPLHNERSIKPDSLVDKDKRIILASGRMHKYKQFDLLIRAFNAIKDHHTQWELVILGEGEERAKLENLVSSFKLSSSVFMPGYKSNVFNFLNNSKCFISSSLYEDPGFSLIEAGSINKIVIAPDTKTGPSEILDESNRGFLFKKNDLSSLVEKFFEFYYSNEKLLNLKKIKMKKYTKNFTLFSHYQEFIKIIICSNNIKKDQ